MFGRLAMGFANVRACTRVLKRPILLQALPSGHVAVLDVLIPLLESVQQAAAATRMSSVSLATVLAPCVLRHEDAAASLANSQVGFPDLSPQYLGIP